MTVDDHDLAARVARLTLEQKVRLLTGADFWSLYEEPEVGLRRLVVSDGPAGVRGETWDERDTSANVPSPTALAATWDEALVHRLGRLLAHEAREKHVDVLLAPTVNLHRTPYGGRHFECFSEDPLLSARIGLAYTRGVQRGGVGATVKHFVGNDSETERMTVDVHVDERALRELYLAPFEAIVREGGVWSVMAAYNGVNGHPMTESPLLREILHEEWGWDGLVMSDWTATRSTVESARAALDLAMPGPSSPWGDALVQAVRAGELDEATIDDKVMRILRLAARVGALEGVEPDPAPFYDGADVPADLRRMAAAGFVLVRNQAETLPLDRRTLGHVAVLGPNAAAARTLGGGSATVFPPYTVSPLDALRAALEARVDHAIGVVPGTRTPVARPPYLRLPDGSEGVEVRFLAEDGTVLGTERRPGAAFNWMGGFGPDVPAERVARVEVHTTLRATDAGRYAVGGSGVGRLWLSVRGEQVFDERLALPPGADVVEGIMSPPQRAHEVELDGDEEVDVVLGYEVGDTGDFDIVVFQLNLQPPHGTDDEEIERAVALARDADVAVVVVGTTEEVESEGFDRTSLALPGRQDELVQRVAAANPRTVVVVNAGAPVLLPWADDVAAVLLAWFPGQEFGNALADVLLGEAEPGGRLPTTWPASEEAQPTTQPVDGVLTYDEGMFVGYRMYDRDGREPRYPFGHGLGYTTWEYAAVDAPEHVVPGEDVAVAVTIRNTGDRRGREVVQVYASRPEGSVERPVRWLAGFATVDGDPGDELSVRLRVRARALEHWDGRWTVEPGSFRLAAGPSAVAQPVATYVEVRD
ncbi:MAG TPA: glycoside hydrolase family 3 C-terminal domain-containing protein [Solirubrobacteraceae bacterium]|jgi:beta-glucosidase|nr:glycoside hydrolase family 3 C-terminal domain-containing protein [Solirubrobacteraceae bacterium]